MSDRKKVLRHHFGLDRLEAVSGEAKARLKACDVPGLVSAKRFAIEAEDRWTLTRRKQADARGEQQAAMERLKEAREEAEKSLELLQLAGPLQAYSDLASRAVDLKDKLATERERLRQDLPDPARAKLAVSKERKKEADRRDLQADLRGLGVEGERLRIRQEEAEAALALSNTAPCMGTKLEFSCQVLKEARGRDCPSHEDFEKVERRTKTVEGKLIQIGEPNVQAAEGQVVVVERNERLRLQSLETKSALDKVRHQMRMARKELPKELPEGSLIQDAKAAARARDAAEKAYTEAALKAGGADQDVERAFNRHEEAQLHLKRAQESAADAGAYEFLAKAFGRNGIQAHEVDYKAPKLEAYANEILQAGWPNRFRLELRTQRDRKGVSRQHAENRIESLDVVVHDALRARMGTAESVSGGERVLLDEALRTAQALIASESGGWDSRMMTAWRDEVPAVLYGEVARRHVAMLAKARELGGFHQILFVGGPVAAAVADAVIEITEDGRIECTRN
ncbi:MAG: hypothetical protein GY871_04120 [Actinomycetales bacterium]|nr:hypothetical protein [Actinomycetales bacterium]